MDHDLIIRDAALASGERVDVAVGAGTITAIVAAGTLAGTAGEEVDAGGLMALPGGIDCHVHCNEPGRTSWEGFASASAALAAGGMTAYIDMPLNASPPTTNAANFDLKLAAARANSLLDFALWGGLIPSSLDAIEELHDRGVVGFKAFMCNSSTSDFPACDEATLREGMRRVAALGSIVAVHAEDDALTAALTLRLRAAGRKDARAYIESRPPEVEHRAIETALGCARATGCALHVVHVSTDEGVTMLRAAAAQGIDVSWETTAVYLTLVADDVERLGTIAKCAPVPRGRPNLEALWRQLVDDPRAIVGSDHSPAPWELKATDDFFDAWGGISAAQSTLGLLLEGVERGLAPLAGAVASITANPADRFGLSHKGRLAPGSDADIVLLDPAASWTLEADDLHYRHRFSALTGLPHRGRVVHAFAKGEPVVAHSVLRRTHRGDLLVPDRRSSALRPEEHGNP